MKRKLRMSGFVRHMSYITLRKEILLWVKTYFKKLGNMFISSNQEMLVWQTVRNCLLLVFSWRLRFLGAKIIVYVNKATKITRETFQYARKVGCERKHEEWKMHSKNMSLFLAALGLRYCVRAFSSCGEWGLPSSCGARASQFGRISCRAQAVGTQASVVAARGLSNCGLWAPEPRSSGAQA